MKGSKLVYINHSAEILTGYSITDTELIDFWNVVHPDYQKQVKTHLGKSSRENPQPLSFEYKAITKNGEERWVDYYETLINFLGEIAILCTATNITERKKREYQLKDSIEKFKIIANCSAACTLVLQNRKIVFWNQTFADMTGYSKNELADRDLLELVHPSFKKVLRSLLREIKKQPPLKFELKIIYKNGTDRWMEVTSSIIEHESKPSLLLTIYDIKNRKKSEEAVARLAYHDMLTGIPNRKMLKDRLAQALANSSRNQKKFAVFFLDIDKFKNVNDAFGHEAGDNLLREASNRMVASLRKEDTVARIGGDEFNFIITDIKDEHGAAFVAQKLLKILSRPYYYSGHEITFSFCVGISVYPYDGEEADSLMKNADTALGIAKSRGRNVYQFYTKKMYEKSIERFELDNMLRFALNNNELILHYQPIVELSTGRIIGAEALIRWKRPKKGLIYPDKFIYVAEEIGLMLKIGDWVLNNASKQLKLWTSKGNELFMSVNFSASQLYEADLVKKISRCLDSLDIPPYKLKIELTENQIFENTNQNMNTLNEIKNMGVDIIIDDFGTGFSSLSYFRFLPVTFMKIGYPFISEMTYKTDAFAIAHSTIMMGRSLGLTVIAEHVEEEEQIKLLKTMKCDAAQGFHFSPAVPADEFEDLLEAGGFSGETRKAA